VISLSIPGSTVTRSPRCRGGLAENRVEYLRTCPSAVLGEEPEGFVRAGQLDRIRALGREGGRFFTVGQVGGCLRLC